MFHIRASKFIWLLIIITTSIGCCCVYVRLAERYTTNRLQTTVDDSVYPVYMIPFPSIGICPRYSIDWQLLNNEAPKRFLPLDASNETIETFITFFDRLADVQFTTMRYLQPLFAEEPKPNLKLIDGVDILEVMKFLTIPCKDVFIGECRWRYKYYNCCDLFSVEKTEAGVCYVFNSAISPEALTKPKFFRYYPYRNGYNGEGTGLDAKFRMDENKINPANTHVRGVFVMIKKASEWHADVKFVNENSFTKLAITAHITDTSNRARSETPEYRRCIFEDEVHHALYKKIPGLDYWRGNCRTRCHQEYVLKYCKCNLHFLFPNTESDNFTSCKPSDFQCIYDNAHIFNKENNIKESKYNGDGSNDSMICNCLNNCNQILFDGFFNSLPLFGTERGDNGTNLIRFDIHYQSASILKYYTSVRYTFVELLANFGGIIGLFLGASLLSAVELVYYFTIGLYARLHTQLYACYGKRRPRTHSSQKTRIIKLKLLDVVKSIDDECKRY